MCVPAFWTLAGVSANCAPAADTGGGLPTVADRLIGIGGADLGAGEIGVVGRGAAIAAAVLDGSGAPS
jgi:hypothetical protein